MALPESITFVTGNPGKVEEVRELLDPLGIAVIPDGRGYPEIQHDELQGVAEAGVGYLAATGLEPPFMIEDAGLFISALRGFPGVYSRYALDTIGLHGILDLMRDVELESRTATFQAHICYLDADGVPHHFEGACKGRIADRSRGDLGFGFDPLFIPDGEDRTFGEMDVAQKAALSHRGQAVKAFSTWLANQ